MSEELREELTKLTCDLVRIESIADRPENLASVIDYIAAYLSAIPGIFVERSESGGKPAIVATLRETRSPALMLNGHVDVVVGRPAQFTPEVRDGRIYARGSQDMKGSVAVMLRLLKDLAARPERPDVGFQFVADEEIGGVHGTRRLLEEGWRCGFMLCLEPTDLGVLYEHKGAIWVKLDIPGQPAHGSRPWAGVNPVYPMTAGLADLARRYPPPSSEEWRTTVSPTVIHVGAGSRNQIPSSATLTFDCRYIASDSPESIIAAIRECFPGAEAMVDRSGGGLCTDPDHPEVQRLAGVVAARTGAPARFYREHFSTDARYYTHAGIPAICIGPLGAGLHSDEEWVDIASLSTLYEIIADFVG
ncbi:M20/M25/M40 family metallo-hydrolase [Chloroflexales bacterium ZM16-3]|nr:M20/M25/M40 family metallo-hydrolase [Chloroflexales bacterium ZM16-3]